MKLISLLSLVLSLLYVSIDFSIRFLNVKESKVRIDEQIDTSQIIVLPQLPIEKISKLNSAYSQYQPEFEAIKEAITGLTLEQQLQQNGELLEFYQGDWRYRLLAVISPDGSRQALEKPLALLRATNIKDSNVDKKVETIYHNTKFENYEVRIIGIKSVQLNYQDQNITLLMYQEKNKLEK